VDSLLENIGLILFLFFYGLLAMVYRAFNGMTGEERIFRDT
jgi:hypothetical protein